MSTVKLTAASGGGSISLKGPASSSANVDLLDTSGNLNLADSKQLNIGTGDDLVLKHDGSNSYLTNTTGNLIIEDDSGQIFLQSTVVNIESEDGETQAKFTADAGVELYYNNIKTINTTTQGIRVDRGQSGAATAIDVVGFEGCDAEVYIASDEGDDNNDKWKLVAQTDHTFAIQSYKDGSWKNCLWSNGDATYIYYQGAAKLWTNSAGATVEADLTLYKAGASSSTQLHMWGQDVHQYSVYTGGGNFRWWSQVDGDTIAEVQQDGDIRIDGSYQTGGVDYAEYFESTDGSAIAVGTTVVLDNGKVRAATGSEIPIGVIRPKTSGTSVTGGTHDLNWSGKYLADDYDGILKENKTFCTWKEGDEPKQCWKDRPPTGVTIPDDAVETTKSRKKLNPSFDASKTYVPRSQRAEWNCVGLLGQIPITKGQPTSTNWIKMKERSSTVELWMVK